MGMGSAPARTWLDLILIRVLPTGSFPQDGICDLGERCTAGNRWRPLRTARPRWHVDQTWTNPATQSDSVGLDQVGSTSRIQYRPGGNVYAISPSATRAKP